MYCDKQWQFETHELLFTWKEKQEWDFLTHGVQLLVYSFVQNECKLLWEISFKIGVLHLVTGVAGGSFL